MRVELTEDQALLHRTVREFAAAELRPHAAQWDREGRFPPELIPTLAGLGLLGLTVPAEFGGAGLGRIGLLGRLPLPEVGWSTALMPLM